MQCQHDDVPKRVLVVDDEPKITHVVADYLRTAGFAVTTAANGAAALAAARAQPPDLVVLDLGLPGMDGLDVARELRRGWAMPIIMLTARVRRPTGWSASSLAPTTTSSSRSAPASCSLAFVRSSGGSMARPVGSERFRVGDVAVDTARREVTVLGRQVDLTATEFDLLVPLARQPGRVFTRGQLLDALHGVVVESYERTVDAHVKNIRRKLEPQPHEPRYLLTVHGVGYRLAEGERSSW